MFKCTERTQVNEENEGENRMHLKNILGASDAKNLKNNITFKASI